MFERFTDRARRVVVLAQEEARMLNHNYLGTEHLLLGLIEEGGGVAAQTLHSLGVSLLVVRHSVEEVVGRGESDALSGHIRFSPRAKKVLELSLRESLELGHNYVGTEHILLGLIREGEGVAAQVLMQLGVSLDGVREEVVNVLSGYAEGHRRLPAGRRFFDPFSDLAYGMLDLAAESARDLRHDAIEPSDLLLGLIAGADDAVTELLTSWGIDLEAVRARIDELAAEEEQEEGDSG